MQRSLETRTTGGSLSSDGKIVYRATGGDQAAVPAGAGQTVELDFNAGTGSIK